jgi:hypothetical protein
MDQMMRDNKKIEHRSDSIRSEDALEIMFMRRPLASILLASFMFVSGADASERPCARILSPVCAMSNNTLKQYNNACEADNKKAFVVYAGECRTPAPAKVRACAKTSRPVCAQLGNRMLKYLNACLASADKARRVATDQCRFTL